MVRNSWSVAVLKLPVVVGVSREMIEGAVVENGCAVFDLTCVEVIKHHLQ